MFVRTLDLVASGADGSATASDDVGLDTSRLEGIAISFLNAPNNAAVTVKVKDPGGAEQTIFSFTYDGTNDCPIRPILAPAYKTDGNAIANTYDKLPVSGTLEGFLTAADHDSEVRVTAYFRTAP